MFVKKGHSVGLLFSALALLFGLSGASAGQSLNEAVVIALDQYPAILAAQARAQAADSDIERAQSAHYARVLHNFTICRIVIQNDGLLVSRV